MGYSCTTTLPTPFCQTQILRCHVFFFLPLVINSEIGKTSASTLLTQSVTSLKRSYRMWIRRTERGSFPSPYILRPSERSNPLPTPRNLHLTWRVSSSICDYLPFWVLRASEDSGKLVISRGHEIKPKKYSHVCTLLSQIFSELSVPPSILFMANVAGGIWSLGLIIGLSSNPILYGPVPRTSGMIWRKGRIKVSKLPKFRMSASPLYINIYIYM